jgi:hypothetical protein
MVNNGKIKTRSVPGYELRGVPIDYAKKLSQPLRLVGISGSKALTQASDLKTLGIAKGAAKDPDSLKIQGQKRALSLGLAPGHHLGNAFGIGLLRVDPAHLAHP